MRRSAEASVARLNDVCRSALEAAAETAHRRSHFVVEVEHFLVGLLERADSDLKRALLRSERDPARALEDLSRVLDGFRSGNPRLPALSELLVILLEQSWLAATLELDQPLVRSSAVLMALVDTRELSAVIAQSCPSWVGLGAEAIKDSFDAIRAPGEEPRTAEPGGVSSGGDTPALDRYTVDLTGEARAGRLDPVKARDPEIRQVIDILTRRRQNNPILTGEAGVGKTAVVEGFAQRVAAGRVPPNLRNAVVRALDLGLLQAGAGIRGEFEKRVKSVIDEVKASPRATILFIDEAHTMVGAGAQEGRGDAANLLKPALARGELRTIAATTWSEYKRYFEKDPALARRFQVVRVDEPGENDAVAMLRGVVRRLEEHHDVRILDEAVVAAVRLSHRYIIGRRLPDKAISVLDTAAGRVAVAQRGEPPELEEAARRVEGLRDEIAILKREEIGGPGEAARRVRELEGDLLSASEDEEFVKARYRTERGLVDELWKIRQRLSTPGATPGLAPDDEESLLRRHEDLEEHLADLQGGDPMVPVSVGRAEVAAVISGWTGVPVGKMLAEELNTVLGLRERLGTRVVGQDHALDCIARHIRTYRAGLDDPGKPTGVFLLVGPSGVGKTETAVALADILYGGERSLVAVNMSEYQEAHSVSKLKGAPAGYVGYGAGGVLTEAIRQRPYSVLLLDEIEKAHPDVRQLFYQVFDKGVLEDSEGQTVDFRNTVILLTSNVGAEALTKAGRDGELEDASGEERTECLRRTVWPELQRVFEPAYLGRLTVVPYLPLGDDVIRAVATMKLRRVAERVAQGYGAEVVLSDEVAGELARRCSEVDTGARNLDHIVSQTLLPDLSARLLARVAAGLAVERVEISVSPERTFEYAIEPAVAAGDMGAET